MVDAGYRWLSARSSKVLNPATPLQRGLSGHHTGARFCDVVDGLARSIYSFSFLLLSSTLWLKRRSAKLKAGCQVFQYESLRRRQLRVLLSLTGPQFASKLGPLNFI